jgi:hypothetical protein
MKTRTRARRPTPRPRQQPSGDEHSGLLAAEIIFHFRHMFPATWVEEARNTLAVAAETFLSRRAAAIFARHNTARETTFKDIVRSEIDLQLLAVLELRTTMLPSEYWSSVPMVRLDNLPLAVAGKVIDESVRSQLRKVKDPSVKRGYRWEPRLPTEPLDEKKKEHTKMADNSHDDLDWREKLLARLKNARHPALRAAYKALRSANPPQTWGELASRVQFTEQYLRRLAKREIDQQSAAR